MDILNPDLNLDKLENNAVVNTFKEFGQEHVFKFWEELSKDERQNLLEQALEIDLKQLKNLTEEHLVSTETKSIDFSEITPAEYIKLKSKDTNPEEWAEAKSLGEDAIRSGKVAAFTPAGGQGSRLGFNAPKGMYPVTPVLKNSLFQLFAEKIKAVSKKYDANIPWYIMTSLENHNDTVEFFMTNDFFGFNEEDIQFFSQYTMPAVDFEGKILMSNKHNIARTPDGHGGSFKALVKSGSTEDMAKRGIEVVSFFQIDNSLVRCIDPYFIGFHIKQQSELSSKACIKTDPKEKVGLLISKNGKISTIEYSDFPDEMAAKKDDEGGLLFSTGSIGIHIFDRKFISKLGEDNEDFQLPFHKAVKKISTIDDAGNSISLDAPNGVKFEMFGFDALDYTSNAMVFETLRENEFSPLKNATGKDSPETVLNLQLQLFSSWVKAAGGEIELDENGLPPFSFEIRPSYATDVDEFIEKYDGSPIVEGTVLA